MGSNLMRRPPKYVHGFIDRHGKPRVYFRRAGFKKVPLPGLPWSSQFMEAYEQAVAGQLTLFDAGARRTKPARCAPWRSAIFSQRTIALCS
jgi:hypothetical protein